MPQNNAATGSTNRGILTDEAHNIAGVGGGTQLMVEYERPRVGHQCSNHNMFLATRVVTWQRSKVKNITR